MTDVEKEALRIWALPQSQWPAELALLEKEKVLHNVRWRYRLAVGMRLKTAAAMEHSGCGYLGWPTRTPDQKR